jgi:hypothetical protein
MVPDVALIEIFDFYMAEALDFDPFQCNTEVWVILAHVCRKWRDIVFGSPRRLNMRLYFPARRSVRAMLDTWPPLPIDIWGCDTDIRLWEAGTGNIVAALEHNDRINKIELRSSSKSVVEQVLAAMQKPFPSLTELVVDFFGETAPVVPDLIFSGSAPLLRSLRLSSTQFPLPALRKLLLSATDLVEFRIKEILEPGFISPDAVIACLSGLTRLEEFELGFLLVSPTPWGIRHPPPSTRCFLPALTSLRFKGQREYLEHLIAPIDSPLLDNLDVTLSDPPVFNTPQLAQFIDRTPKLKAFHEAHFFFDNSDIFVSLPWTSRRGLHFRISRLRSNPSVMVQLCTSSFLRTLIPTMKHLYILDSGIPHSFWLNYVESSQWLDLLRPFTTAEDLYISRELSPHIVATLHRIIGEGMTEVLPSLQNVFLGRPSSPGPVEEAAEQFVAALDLHSRPITVSQ